MVINGKSLKIKLYKSKKYNNIYLKIIHNTNYRMIKNFRGEGYGKKR